LAGHENPAFDSSEVMPQLKAVYAMFEKLLKKPKPAPEKVVPIVNATESANITTAEDDTKPSAQDPIEVNIEPEDKSEASDSTSKEEKSAEEEL
jgi:hypothetical protein